MAEKELRRKAIGNHLNSNILLTLKIVFDLIPQILLVYLINSLITQDTESEKLKYIFLAMFFVDPRLALGMITGVPLMYLVKVLSEKTMNKNFAVYFKHKSKMREELMEYVKNISVIKAFAKEEEMSEKTLKTAREYVYWVKKKYGSRYRSYGTH